MSPAVKAFHSWEVKTRAGPVGFFKSRIPTSPPSRNAISTHSLLPELRVLLRHTGRDRSTSYSLITRHPLWLPPRVLARFGRFEGFGYDAKSPSMMLCVKAFHSPVVKTRAGPVGFFESRTPINSRSRNATSTLPAGRAAGCSYATPRWIGRRRTCRSRGVLPCYPTNQVPARDVIQRGTLDGLMCPMVVPHINLVFEI